MKQFTVKCTKYNEVGAEAIRELIASGATIIKSPYANGKCVVKEYNVYSDDEIKINNVTLPCCINGNYDSTITINVLD
jgi:hypothetical protein